MYTCVQAFSVFKFVLLCMDVCRHWLFFLCVNACMYVCMHADIGRFLYVNSCYYVWMCADIGYFLYVNIAQDGLESAVFLDILDVCMHVCMYMYMYMLT
jgi:hypothetical protein